MLSKHVDTLWTLPRLLLPFTYMHMKLVNLFETLSKFEGYKKVNLK